MRRQCRDLRFLVSRRPSAFMERLRLTEICQWSKQPHGNDSNVWHALPGHTAEDLRQIAIRGHGQDDA